MADGEVELLSGNINYARKSVQKIIYYFAEDTLKRCLENMQIQKIGRYNPNAHWKGVGDLERSIDAIVTKNAGGNNALVTFFYLHYLSYVEIAVQRNLKVDPNLPAMTSKEPVERSDGAKRKAKSFLHSQIRRQAMHTLTVLGKYYIYAGAAAFWQAVDIPNDPEIHSKNDQSLQDLARSLGI